MIVNIDEDISSQLKTKLDKDMWANANESKRIRILYYNMLLELREIKKLLSKKGDK